MKLYELSDKISKMLSEVGIVESELEAFYILEYVLKINRSTYFLKKTEEISKEQCENCISIAVERSKHRPLQYILGTQEFMGLTFQVDENVLIPRQDTEGLVEKVLSITKGTERVLDLCTGSGCIGISLKKHKSSLQVTGVDISPKALQVAKKNAENLQADVTWIESDLFEKVTGTFDVIVSNPPYIQSDVIKTLMPEVKDNEPLLALDGREDGLYFYRKIIREAKNYLSSQGILCLEIGYDQGEAVAEFMRQQGFEEISVEQDLSGLDRNVYGKIGGSHV